MYTTRQLLPVAIFSFALLSASLEVNAQPRWKEHSNKHKHHKEYKDERAYHSGHSGNRDGWSKGNKKHYKDRDDYRYDRHYSHKHYDSRRDCYDHPKYGRVYHRFDHQPVVFRHSHGDYYYSGNQFYTYRDGIGYCMVDAPRRVYFRELPFNCTRVYANGHEYYRHGELYFSLSNRGYIIVPAPVEVNFSVRF